MKYTIRGSLPLISNDYVGDVLRARGIEDVETYKKPTKENLYDPYLLSNVEAGVNLLSRHLARGSKIYQIVDSDADGYTSGAVFYNYIKEFSPDTEIVYEVHKGKQHGVIPSNVPEDCELVVVIDAGSNQVEEFRELKEKGHDILVIDHHHLEDEEIHNYATIVNNQIGDYPNRYLSGAGVLYKFFQVFDQHYVPGGSVDDYIDLVALSIISDMMNLSDIENRYLVMAGLNKEVKNIGFQTLIDKQAYSIGDTNHLTPEKIAFYITPLINAIVRVGTQEEKETMFLAFVDGARQLPSGKRGAQPGDFETAAGQTARVATNARNRQNKLKEQAIALMILKIKKYGLDDHKVLLITLNEEESERVDSTLTGLIAMQLTRQYKKPVIVSRVDGSGELFQGSLRGINDSALDDFRQFAEDSGLVEYASGHANAAGLGIKRENREAFLEYADRKLKDIDFSETFYEVDYEFSDTDDIYEPLMQLAQANQMWGQGVAPPVFVIKDAQIFAKDVQLMGRNKEHLKFKIGGVDCVKFFATDLINEIGEAGSFTITILGKANLNNWMGNITPQLMIEDYEVKANTFDF